MSPEQAVPILIETVELADGHPGTIELYGTASGSEVLQAMRAVLERLRELEENSTV